MRSASSALLYGAVLVLLCVLECCVSELGMVFIRHPEPLAAPLGDEVDLECGLNLPAEKFAWRHRPLNSKSWGPLMYTQDGGKISRHVVNFNNESQAGDYRCIAYYGTSGLASDPARLSLATMEDFQDKKCTELRVSVGNTVPITCPVPYSCPEAIVDFIKDDVLLKNISLVDGKTLILQNVTISDSGQYHCLANNYITSQTIRSKHKLTLTVHSDNKLQPPIFVKQPQTEYKVLPGGNVTLECLAVGYPVPRVTWTRLGRSLPSKASYSPAGLIIVNVQPSDRGEYDCVWNNSLGSLRSSIILKVIEVPRVVKPPRTATFSEGGDLELFCNVTGQPEPTVEWLINGEVVTEDINSETVGCNLYISPVEKKHAGIVQCVASNEYGSHSGYNLLRVNPKQHVGGTTESRPDYGSHGLGHNHREHTRVGGRRRVKNGRRKEDVLVPPDQPNVTRLSDVSVMVRWSVPDNKGLPILFFKVQHREVGQKLTKKQAKWMTANMEIPNHVRSFEVTDLQPDHTYRFRIAAVYSNNDNKLSPNSNRFHLNRDVDVESNKMPIPLLVNTEALGANEVLLVWQNPNKTADIDGFYVYHRASTSAGDYVKTTVEGNSLSQISISHLQPDTTYEFKVQSFSVDAASEFSQILREKTLKVEPPVQQGVADNKVKPPEDVKNDRMFAIVGGALGGVALLSALGVIGVVYKRSKRKQSQEIPQSQDKPVANGRVLNGGINDSKINITSNPLAGLDPPEDPMQPKSGQQSSMEMASFINGQNNNSHNNGDNTCSAGGEPSLQFPQPTEQPL